MNNLPLDEQIDAAHAEAERVEADARAVEARIVAAGGIPPLRRYGRPIDPRDVAKNLTLVSILNRKDPALASWLGVQSGSYVREAQEREQRAAQVERMQQLTEQTRQRNHAAAEQRYRRQLSPKPNGWRVG